MDCRKHEQEQLNYPTLLGSETTETRNCKALNCGKHEQLNYPTLLGSETTEIRICKALKLIIMFIDCIRTKISKLLEYDLINSVEDF